MVLGDRAAQPLARVRGWLQDHWPALSAGVAGVVGVVILGLGAYGFAGSLRNYVP
jgi:hypothetical protein